MGFAGFFKATEDQAIIKDGHWWRKTVAPKDSDRPLPAPSRFPNPQARRAAEKRYKKA